MVKRKICITTERVCVGKRCVENGTALTHQGVTAHDYKHHSSGVHLDGRQARKTCSMLSVHCQMLAVNLACV
eukprot:1157790-Pelagomonas_calceolata.AAC.13